MKKFALWITGSKVKEENTLGIVFLRMLPFASSFWILFLIINGAPTLGSIWLGIIIAAATSASWACGVEAVRCP